MNFLVSAVTHLPPIKVAQRKQYKELPSPQVRASLAPSCASYIALVTAQCLTAAFPFRPSGCEERPVGQPGALQPAAGMRQHVRQLVWLHASGPLPVSPGPCAVQGPSVRPAQEVQRPGEGLKKKTAVRNVQKLLETQRWWADCPAL